MSFPKNGGGGGLFERQGLIEDLRYLYLSLHMK